MKPLIKLTGFGKSCLLLLPITFLFYPFTKLMLFLSYLNKLLVWIYGNKKKFEYREPVAFNRNYNNRYNLYKYISDNYLKDNSEIVYLEFGVAGGTSFKWWLNENKNDSSRFYGFDTFEGLPENWGMFFRKGDMQHQESQVQDNRVKFVKGLFQDTLVPFIQENRGDLKSAVRKIVHMDADLYSSTIFVLTQLYPYLQPGDIILFDEFNVPLHEFKAFNEFTKAFYIELKPLGAVNNYLQVAFVVK